MVKVRTAKNKGSNFEYSCKDSLVKVMPDILLTKELGFVLQYDLISKDKEAAFECKRHKAFSWNQLIKLFDKLKEKAPDMKDHYLLLQANRQPCLVMYDNFEYGLCVQTFEQVFKNEFIKH